MMDDQFVHSSRSTTLPGSLMSRYSTPSAPASELGNLALGSSSSGSSGKRMAPTTRSMSRRQTLASPAASSRATPNPARVSHARSGASSRQLARQPESDDEEEDESDSDDDDSDEESEDDEPGNVGDNGGGADALARQKTIRVFDIYALSEPNNLIGAELMVANGNSEDNTRMHQRLAVLAAQEAQASPAFWNTLVQAVQIPGPLWSQIMCANLTRRLRSIFEDFHRGLRGPTYGPDVITTAEALRDFVNATDRITANGYWAGMNDESRRRFASLLLTTVEQVVEADMDAYEDNTVPRPSYAGQTAEHTNLYQRLVGTSPTSVFGVASLLRLDIDGRLLAGSSPRLTMLHQRVVGKYAVIGGDGRLTARGSSPVPTAFIQSLDQLKNNAQLRAG